MVLKEKVTSLLVEKAPEEFTELARKDVLSVEDYCWLLDRALVDQAAHRLIEQKLFSGFKASRLFSILSNKRDAFSRRDFLKKNKFSRFESLEKAMVSLLPNVETAIANLLNYFEAFLLIPELSLKKKLFGLLSEHFRLDFNLYHYLEVAALLKRNMVQAGKKSGYNLSSAEEITSLKPEHLGNLISLLVGLMTLYLPNEYLVGIKGNLAHIHPLMNQLLPSLPDLNVGQTIGSDGRGENQHNRSDPQGTSVLIVKNHDGSARTVKNTGVGFFAECLLAAKMIGAETFSGERAFDTFEPRTPERMEWLTDWRERIFYRLGLSYCFEGLTAGQIDGGEFQQATSVVFPRKNGLPLVLLVNRNLLSNPPEFTDLSSHDPGSLEQELILGIKRAIASYQSRPCLEDAAYPSGTKLMEALLMFDQERYQFKLPERVLELANLGSVSLVRRGWFFEFKTTTPAEKKIYELGVRNIAFKKPEKPDQRIGSSLSAPVLARVEVGFVGEIKIGFYLSKDGSINDLGISDDSTLSAAAINWLTQLSMIYLGCLENRVPEGDGQVADSVQGNEAQVQAEDSTENHKQKGVNSFRVMPASVPNHHGMWLDPAWPVNIELETRLGANLQLINELFITLQVIIPCNTPSIGENEVFDKAMEVVAQKDVQERDQKTLSTLLELLWHRANRNFAKHDRKEPNQQSRRLAMTIRKGLLGDSAVIKKYLDEGNPVFTVTFVKEPEEDGPSADVVEPEEDEPSAQPAIYHLPQVAEAVLG